VSARVVPTPTAPSRQTAGHWKGTYCRRRPGQQPGPRHTPRAIAGFAWKKLGDAGRIRPSWCARSRKATTRRPHSHDVAIFRRATGRAGTGSIEAPEGRRASAGLASRAPARRKRVEADSSQCGSNGHSSTIRRHAGCRPGPSVCRVGGRSVLYDRAAGFVNHRCTRASSKRGVDGQFPIMLRGTEGGARRKALAEQPLEAGSTAQRPRSVAVGACRAITSDLILIYGQTMVAHLGGRRWTDLGG